MSTIHKCDRCRKEIYEPVTVVKIERRLGPYANAADPNNKAIEFDLCPKCVKELKSWRENYKEAVQP